MGQAPWGQVRQDHPWEGVARRGRDRRGVRPWEGEGRRCLWRQFWVVGEVLYLSVRLGSSEECGNSYQVGEAGRGDQVVGVEVGLP